MVKNLFKIAVRNLLKSKMFSLINIFGLAFGLCSALLIALWVNDEYSIDNHHSKKDRIHYVISEMKTSTGSEFWTNSPTPLAKVLTEEIPGIEQVVRFSSKRELLFIQDDQSLEESGMFADPEILTIFDFPLVEGDIKSALVDLNSIVLSKQLADKLFPNAAAIDQTVTIDYWGERQPYKITGILMDIPKQSTLQFNFIIPFEKHLDREPRNRSWGNYNSSTVVLLEGKANLGLISDKVKHIMPRHQDEVVDTEIHLYPFKDIYLKADFTKGLHAEGRIKYVRLFTIIALIVVLIACINFMNLSTARAGKRAKEVGIRKTSGASRRSLILQFLGESILIALISGVLAVTLADVFMVPFNELTGKSIMIPYDRPIFIVALVGLCSLTGFLAGIFPALYLSGFSPVKVLKSAVSEGKSLSGFRRVLVIFQFSLSIIFIITTIVIYSQLQYVINKDLGFNKENILRHHLNSIMGNKEAYRNEILKLPGVRQVTHSNSSLVEMNNSTIGVDWKGKSEGDKVNFRVARTDQYFVETFGLTLLEGKGFSEKYDTARSEVIINEAAAKVMALEHPVGSRFKLYNEEVEVVGLVQDFNHQSLDKGIEPVILSFNTERVYWNFVAIEGNVRETISAIGQVYSKFEKNYPFDYSFVDQNYASFYKQVTVIGRLSSIFAIVGILISSLGLFGLASYMTEQRKKETGIRKVMGASVMELVTMFSKKFLGFVLISFVLGSPIAWYVSKQWLNDFAFKIDLGLSPFVVGGMLALIVALLTVSYHTIKAAIANPVESLKYE